MCACNILLVSLWLLSHNLIVLLIYSCWFSLSICCKHPCGLCEKERDALGLEKNRECSLCVLVIFF